MEASQCNLDSFTLFGIIALGLFIALLGGLISKDKDSRRAALMAGFTISIGGTIFVWIFNCI